VDFGFVFQSQGVDSEKNIWKIYTGNAIFIQSRKVYFSSSCLDMPSTYSLYYLLLICVSNRFDVDGDLKCIVHQRRCYICIHVPLQNCWLWLCHLFRCYWLNCALDVLNLHFICCLWWAIVSTWISYTIY